MLLDSLEISGNKKRFFSDRFNLNLNFHVNGGITGTLYPFAKISTISKELSGLYEKVNTNIVLTCMCEFIDPNLTSKSLITFSGEILEYEKDHECLILRWVLIHDNVGYEIIDRDIEILFNSPNHDNDASKKIRTHIHEHSLQMMGE